MSIWGNPFFSGSGSGAPSTPSGYVLIAELIDTTSNWTTPADALPYIVVDGSAGGSGGGGAYTNGGGGGGGAGGKSVEGYGIAVAAGTQLTATIGAGGAAGTSGLSPTAGSAGGTTSLAVTSTGEILLELANVAQTGGQPSNLNNGGNGGVGTRGLEGEGGSVTSGGTGGAVSASGNNGSPLVSKQAGATWFPGGSGSGGAGVSASNSFIRGGGTGPILGVQLPSTTTLGVGGAPGTSRWCRTTTTSQDARGPLPHPHTIAGDPVTQFGYGQGGAGATGATSNQPATPGTQGMIRIWHWVPAT